MEKTDLDYFQKKLEAEKITLEEELGEIAKINPKNPDDWEAVPAETDEISSRDETADRFEELDERAAAVAPLEIRLRAVHLALEKIKTNNYGLCAVCQELIERERLEANPAAATCKLHLAKTKH
ncbi:MAG: TraR/DksA C4-type zinc finger protein [Patescibacteria group bacterium]